MKLKLLWLIAWASAPVFCASAQFNGYWDITVHESQVNEQGNPRPRRAWWLKIEGAGTPQAKGMFSSAYNGNINPIDEISTQDDNLMFGFRPVERRRDGTTAPARHLVYKARLVGGKLDGTFEVEGGNRPPIKWTGVRTPPINDKDDGTWIEGKAVTLFNGKDLSGWHPVVPKGEAGWVVENGLLISTGTGSDIISEAKFWNFNLHLEYRLPKPSNSGIGLRSRYEVQIGGDYGRPPGTHSTGALYAQVAPSENAGKPVGEWGTFDIRLIGKQVSITLNGKKVIDKADFEAMTAVSIDPNEAEPGPLMLQGDHGTVEFRNIVVTPLVKKK